MKPAEKLNSKTKPITDLAQETYYELETFACILQQINLNSDKIQLTTPLASNIS